MQAGGQEFDSPHLHQTYRIVSYYQVIDDMEVSCRHKKSTLKTEQCKDKELIFQILEKSFSVKREYTISKDRKTHIIVV